MKATTQNVNRVLADAGHHRGDHYRNGFHSHGSSIGDGGWMVSTSARSGVTNPLTLDEKAELLDAYTPTLVAAGWNVTRSGYMLIVEDPS